jgi:hypothetical protein
MSMDAVCFPTRHREKVLRESISLISIVFGYVQATCAGSDASENSALDQDLTK